MTYSVISVANSHKTQAQILKAVENTPNFKLIMQSQNALDAASMVKKFQVHMVIMEDNMSFYNADMFIQDALIRNSKTQFILLSSDMSHKSNPGISSVISPDELTSETIIAALEKAASNYSYGLRNFTPPKNKDWKDNFKDWILQNNLVLNCISNRIDLNNIPGELTIFKDKPFTLFLCEIIGHNAWSFYNQSAELLIFLVNRIKAVLPDENGLVLIASDRKMCILLDAFDEDSKKADELCRDIRNIYSKLSFPELIISSSGTKNNIYLLPSIYREVDNTLKYHFFANQNFLMYTSWLSTMKTESPANALEDANIIIENIYASFSDKTRDALENQLSLLNSLIRKTYSFNSYHHIWNQLCFLYQYEARNNRQIPDKSFMRLKATEFITIDTAFDTLKKYILKLFDQIFYETQNSDASTLYSIKEYMKENISTNFKMTEIADKLHLSPSYFSHLFKTEFGESYSSYNNRIRIQAAIKLMDKADNLQELASMVGIPDSKYFIKLFKKHTGTTPKQYKLSRKEN